MPFEYYIKNGNKSLRCGFTTGTCAAIGAKGAVTALLSGTLPTLVSVVTPKGIEVETQIVNGNLENGTAVCSVIKDGGDDIDATNGLEICVSAKKTENGISIDGGKGVGRVTKKGLDQPVGNAAINSTPRKMIKNTVEEVCREYGYKGGIEIVVSVPEGEKTALKTFNPNIGIEGGISIIGTSGIVEPQSLKALADTVKLELNVVHESGKENVVITPGNYGETFLKEHMDLKNISYVKCSNFVGEALEEAVRLGFKNILLVGHMGKFVKLAGGLYNTHSMYGDCRMEIFGVHAAMSGYDSDTIRDIMNCATADAAIEILERDKEKFKKTINSIIDKIQFYIDKKTTEENLAGVVVFTNQHGLMGISEKGKEAIKRLGG